MTKNNCTIPDSHMFKTFLVLLLLLPAPSYLRAAPQVSFADLQTARAAIVDDPAYFDRLQPMEMEAKSGRPLAAATLVQQRTEFRRRYQAGVRGFSDEEKTGIRNVVAIVDRAVRQNYPRYADTPWNFLKVTDNIEGGFPHTRGKHIIFCESVCRWLAAERGGPAGRRVPLDKMELLLHEQMHVFQRAHAEEFDSLYAGLWGLIRAKAIATCPWIVEHQLVNPDAIDCPWVFADPSARRHSLRLAAVLAARRAGPEANADRFLEDGLLRNARRRRLPRRAVVRRPAEARAAVERAGVLRRLSTFDEIYHPHEAAADLFAKLVLFDAYNSARMSPASALWRRSRSLPCGNGSATRSHPERLRCNAAGG